MFSVRTLAMLFLGAVICMALLAHSAAAVDFDRDVRPILSNHCFACHGPDAEKRQADLRLDRPEEAHAAGIFGNDPASESELIRRISSTDPDEVMPPPDFGKPLKPEQIKRLKDWILAGAEYDMHWSFAPLVRPEPPAATDAQLDENPIDRFVVRKLAAENATLSPPASPARLCRRLFLDLLGMPPKWSDLQAFERDYAARGSAATLDLINKLFASDSYGERMAAHWLDLVRYADTVGFHGDQNQNVYPYRDYVIQAFQMNKPFDQFTIEQLAGDLLPSATPEQRIASGFNRLNMMTREGGAQPKEYLAKYQADRVRTVGITWLGLTTGCAECHDHKYDPFTTRDFYRLSAFFADLKQWGVYADYGYTPNADLKGYDNDSPFPPELEVFNRGLLLRQRRIHKQILSLCRNYVSQQPSVRTTFSHWASMTQSWLAENSTGWRSLDLESVPNDQAAWQFFRPGFALAALRLDLPPDDPQLAGRSLQVQISLLDPQGNSKPLSFRRADASSRAERYRGGARLLDVRDGWPLPSMDDKRELGGIWQFADPLVLDEGARVVVRVSGLPENYPAIRVSASPIPSLRPWDLGSAEEWIGSQGNAWPSDMIVSYCLGYCQDEKTRNELHGLESGYRKCRDGWTWTQVSVATTPFETRVLRRGNWLDDSGEVVVPGLPEFLDPQRGAEEGGKRLTRLDLARWLVSAENPLVARAVVNRLWAQYLGTGLCATLDDLGAQGESPSHPELLNWLACEFRDKGWDLQHVMRLILTSRTYQQDSRSRPDLAKTDPGNRLLAWHPARRLEAEAVRDNILSISGLLRHDPGGPACWPAQPAGYYANLQFPDRDYVADSDGSQHRRGIYMHWQRTFLHPMLVAFDAPSREDCIALRNRSNTPQQALVLLNDPTYVEAAASFAEIIMHEGRFDNERIQVAFQTALGREPNQGELKRTMEFVNEQRRYYQQAKSEADQIASMISKFGHRSAKDLHRSQELATWFAFTRMILNLHEVITRY